MDATIHYCRLCGLEPRAREIAAALRREYGLECEIREGFWGTFRIEHGGEEVFNRWKSRGWLGRLGLGRTPTADEVVAQFRERASRAIEA
jgi:selenoprotein W-related protein